MKIVHVGRNNIDSDYAYVRKTKGQSPNIATNQKFILDLSPRYGKVGGDIDDFLELKEVGYVPSYIIPNLTTNFPVLAMTLDHPTKLLARLEKFNQDGMRDLFDSHYVDAVIIPPFVGRLAMLRNMYTSWSYIPREIWLYDFESPEIFKECNVMAELPMITGIITSIITDITRKGWLFNYSEIDSDCYYGTTYNNFALDKRYDFMVIYNRYVLECWLKGIRPLDFIEFLKGEK